MAHFLSRQKILLSAHLCHWLFNKAITRMYGPAKALVDYEHSVQSRVTTQILIGYWVNV